MNPHNPENYSSEIPQGFRFLTENEANALASPNFADKPEIADLRETLAPLVYSQAACRWEVWQLGKPLNLDLSYITDASPAAFLEVVAAPYFIQSFNMLAEAHHAIMVEKGFWDSRTRLVEAAKEWGGPELEAAAIAAIDGQAIALIQSEASEALEGIRHGNGPDDKVPEFNAAEAEFSDVILRMMDLAYARGWNVPAALVAKLHMNKGRGKMHGGKKF